MKDFYKICPKFDVIISCIGSRTGATSDAWNIEYEANKNLLEFALSRDIDQFILLSAICVQKPKLEFQYAKLAFEQTLIQSKVNYTIVRPTAFFKSLSGQVNKVKNGNKFIYFDNGKTTSCKPISEKDLAQYICNCIGDNTRLNQILPIGGPGPAITPLEMGHMLFKALDIKPKFKSVPSKIFRVADKAILPLTFFSEKARNIQQFLRIANFYATESMLLYNEKTMSYDDMLTPEYGTETLESHYRKLLRSEFVNDELGDHKLF